MLSTAAISPSSWFVLVDAPVPLSRRLKAYRKIKYITPEKLFSNAERIPVDFCKTLRHDSDKCWPPNAKADLRPERITRNVSPKAENQPSRAAN